MSDTGENRVTGRDNKKRTCRKARNKRTEPSIRADGYSGQWRADDGATYFQYVEKPARCFEVKFNGPSMEMYKDGKIDGNGMLVDGNPNDL